MVGGREGSERKEGVAMFNVNVRVVWCVLYRRVRVFVSEYNIMNATNKRNT